MKSLRKASIPAEKSAPDPGQSPVETVIPEVAEEVQRQSCSPPKRDISDNPGTSDYRIKSADRKIEYFLLAE